MTITTKLEPGDIVSHIADNAARGVVVAFMVRGNTHTYQVQWGKEDGLWHCDFELTKTDQPPASIGFWRDAP